MSKKTNEYNYILAYNILKGIDIISSTECQDENSCEIILQSEQINPEQLLIKKDSFENLSQEAKELILIIINAPQEFLDLFKTPARLIWSRNFFKKCLVDSLKSKIIAESIIEEISIWVKQNLK